MMLFPHLQHLATLIEQEEDMGATALSLNIISAGLFSTNLEVALWTCKTIHKLGNYLDELKLLGHAYEWFVRPSGGLESVVECHERHSDSTENLVTILTQYGKNNLVELFTHYLSTVIQDKARFMSFICEIYTVAADTIIVKNALVTSGVLEAWIELAIRQSDDDDPLVTASERGAALCFLTEVWAR